MVLKLAELHDNLTESLLFINENLGFTMLNITAFTVSGSIFSIFSLYRMIVRNELQYFNLALMNNLCCGYFFIFLVVMIACCSLLTKTGKYAAILVHNVIAYIDDYDDPIIDYFQKELILKLAELHDNLTESLLFINEKLGSTMFIITAFTVSGSIFSIFSLYRVIVRNELQYFNLALMNNLCCGYFFLLLVVTIALCSLLTKTGKYAAILVHNAIAYIDDYDDPIIDYLKMFSQQLQHRSPTVHCGFFAFDFTLLFMIVGTSTTYVVILIQFDSNGRAAHTDLMGNGNSTIF
ncbi:CLUMA_CG000719, isoform A [Clunio marinus]|uniref:Gustatory receptor n=1 Tax=Clunio marinus TaxID=568069 RepID=A0A1J1HKY4_9DIPT|nr:CLUMA_CG000719, isoform A [Clunio marinus]